MISTTQIKGFFMKAKFLSILLLGLLNLAFVQAAELEKIIPIKDVWSVGTVGDKVILRFKGSDDDSQVLQYSNLGRAEIRNLETWEIVRAFENVRWVALSPDSKIAGVLYGDETAQFLELGSNIILKELNNVKSIFFSPKGRYVKVVNHESTQIIETENWRIKYEFKTLERPDLTFAFHEDYFGIVGDDERLKIVSTHTGKVINEFIGDFRDHALNISPDGKYLTIGYKNGTSALIEMGSWQVIKKFENCKLLVFDEDKYLFRKTINDTLEIIDLDGLHVQFEVPEVIFFAGNGKHLWVIQKNNMAVQVIELEMGNVVLDGLNNAEECRCTENGRFLAALPNEVRVYKLPKN